MLNTNKTTYQTRYVPLSQDPFWSINYHKTGEIVCICRLR